MVTQFWFFNDACLILLHIHIVQIKLLGAFKKKKFKLLGEIYKYACVCENVYDLFCCMYMLEYLAKDAPENR